MEEAISFLKSHKLMMLATTDGTAAHATTLYYGVSDSCTLYFLSDADTTHCIHIISFPKVGVAITDTQQDVTDKKQGIQLEGKASQVIDDEEMLTGVTLWNRSNKGFSQIISYESIKSRAISNFVYKVTPQKLKFFNEALYGSEGVKIFDF